MVSSPFLVLWSVLVPTLKVILSWHLCLRIVDDGQSRRPVSRLILHLIHTQNPPGIVPQTDVRIDSESSTLTVTISALAGSASPLKVINSVPGDRSNATSRASTALGYNDEAVGTPRAGITKPRFLSLRGEGLRIPSWREYTNETEGGLDFTRAFNDVARSWSSDRNSDTFTSIPERRSRMRFLTTRSFASFCSTTADSSMVDLDRVEDSPNEIVGLPHAPLNPAPYQKERA